MDNPFDYEPIEDFKEELLTNGPASAAAKIQEYLDQQDNIPLNIGITGETDSGKSTFVNAFRGIDNRDERAAPTGCVETTSEATPYPHPNYPNVTLWDLPGIGTPNFSASNYLECVEFEKFDFFIIISADRFRENDVKLAQEIQRMKKKFYFVRSKIDHNLRLNKQGFESPQVFLVSSRHLHLYDFHLLEETLERELPAHKRNTLLLAMPNISHGIISKKKEALQAKIKYLASISALIAATPVPGVSFATDIAMLVSTISRYQVTFGLDSKSLQSLARSARVPLDDLRSVMTSQLGLHKIKKELIIKMLCLSVSDAALMAAEEGFRFVPLFGIPAAASLSFIFTYKALYTFLDMLVEDAQKGAQGHYIPWQTLDLTGLVSRLPDIHDGASRWIRAFEEATIGKLLALGDVKAVWAQTLGASAMENMLKRNECEWMISPMADGTEFDAYHGKLWAALRREYPTRVDPKALQGDPFRETDNPATYINNHLKRWRQETEEDIRQSQVLTTLVRDSVTDALPTPVQSKLRDIVALTTMPHRQFCDNVIHAVERHRKDGQRMKEQDREVQRKLAQLQLSELQSKVANTQVPVTAEKMNHTLMNTPTTQPTQPLQPPPVVNIYPQPYTQPHPPPGACWQCGELGHRAVACPQVGPGPVEGGGFGAARRGGMATVVSLEPMITPKDIILIREEAGQGEHSLWLKRGAAQDEKGFGGSMRDL
ncbi:hypothetical protein ABVT39_018820 [Epinephelus coioides]